MTGAMLPHELRRDWTCDASGRSNSSQLYLETVAEVASFLRNLRVGQDPQGTARLVVSHLAHARGFAPVQPAGPDTERRVFASGAEAVAWLNEPEPDTVERVRDAVHDFEMASEPTGYGSLARRRYDEARDELRAAVAAVGPVGRAEDTAPLEGVSVDGLLALKGVAESHDNCCSPSLRHAARRALGLGDCEPIQGCVFCDGSGDSVGRPCELTDEMVDIALEEAKYLPYLEYKTQRRLAMRRAIEAALAAAERNADAS